MNCQVMLQKLGPSIQTNILFRSICQQICYTDMLPFEDIPDDTVRQTKSQRKAKMFPQVPVTAYLKELLQLATAKRPLLIFLDSVDELTGSQVRSVLFLNLLD